MRWANGQVCAHARLRRSVGSNPAILGTDEPAAAALNAGASVEVDDRRIIVDM